MFWEQLQGRGIRNPTGRVGSLVRCSCEETRTPAPPLPGSSPGVLDVLEAAGVWLLSKSARGPRMLSQGSFTEEAAVLRVACFPSRRFGVCRAVRCLVVGACPAARRPGRHGGGQRVHSLLPSTPSASQVDGAPGAGRPQGGRGADSSQNGVVEAGSRGSLRLPRMFGDRLSQHRDTQQARQGKHTRRPESPTHRPAMLSPPEGHAGRVPPSFVLQSHWGLGAWG